MANSTFSGPVRSQNGFLEWDGTDWVPISGGGGSAIIPITDADKGTQIILPTTAAVGDQITYQVMGLGISDDVLEAVIFRALTTVPGQYAMFYGGQISVGQPDNPTTLTPPTVYSIAGVGITWLYLYPGTVGGSILTFTYLGPIESGPTTYNLWGVSGNIVAPNVYDPYEEYK